MIDHAWIAWVLPVIGFALPVALLVASTRRNSFERSISAYYHQPTPMDDIYVGGLAAIGVCLLAYRGDDGALGVWPGMVAGVSALVTAYTPPGKNGRMKPMNLVHLVASVVFLVMLICFAYLFIGTGGWHLVFFLIMVAGAVVSIVGWILWKICNHSSSAVFVGETAIVWAFSAAWIFKIILGTA